MNRLASTILILAVASSACSTTSGYSHRPVPYRVAYSAYDEGYRSGLSDGRWAGHRDQGKPHRTSYWNDGRYRSATNGYRSQFGSKFEYSDGFRAGYERGYREERGYSDRRRPH